MNLTVLLIAHPLLASPALYALDGRAWTVQHEDGETFTYPARPISAESGSGDDAGQDDRDFGVSDPELLIWNLLLDNIGGDMPVTVVQREYDTSDLSEPISVSAFEIDSAEIGINRALSFTAASPSVDYESPRLEFNTRNTPQLRR